MRDVIEAVVGSPFKVKAPDEEGAASGAPREPTYRYRAECQKCGWNGPWRDFSAHEARADAKDHEAQRKHKRHPILRRALIS